MTALPNEILLFAIALGASLALGLMARLATANGAAGGWRLIFTLVRRRWLIVLAILTAGAVLGLWSFADVRGALFDMLGGFWPFGGGDASPASS